MPLARISLTLSRHSSLSSIVSGTLHPVSIQSCSRYILAGCPTPVRPWEGVHRKTSLMSSSLLLQQCLACLVRLIWMVFVIGGRWPYSYCFVGSCFQDLFNITRSILVKLPSNLFSIRFVSVNVVHLYSSMDTTAVWEKMRFISSDRYDFHVTNNQLIAVHAFTSRVSMTFSVNETLLPS